MEKDILGGGVVKWGAGGKGWLSRLVVVCTYIVLVLTKIGWPKNAGTFSSISECVLMKFNVGSGSVRESLWQEPGRGSGTCNWEQTKKEKCNTLRTQKQKKEQILKTFYYKVSIKWNKNKYAMHRDI